MKRTTVIENCLPSANGLSRGSTPRSHRLCEEVATRYFGPFVEINAANETFIPSESASSIEQSSMWRQACERFVHIRDRLTPYIRPDDLLAGAFVRGNGPTGPGWPRRSPWALRRRTRPS